MRAITILVFVLLVGAARAEDQAPAPETGRFAMTPAPNGFLRLDKETGAVAHCAVEDGLSVCRAAADERAALEAEIARLSRENAELRAKLGGAEAPKKPWPGEQELDRALSFTEKFVRRMMKLFREETPEGERL
ncbi:hypothetical protein [Methylosinus sp. Sm6]|uniref:hypothetical protein n=1 Tax=Methylosinus sp. Sm6 TaxID=2866948 RepID=UPI001C9A0AC1|nr:hypothetical protein [Methylosinus sp. Sm6]MBY6242758.1 hypothetical protein [Methylosinus sp. Sm6]